MGNINILPIEVEYSLKSFIIKKFEEDNLRDFFQNSLLRDDVLELLDRYCTVVYYPLENEGNNGFHITEVPFVDGTRHNFVFINTAQTIEKQVFTAAHELGHIWDVDEHVISELGLEASTEMREMIINRFAAILLIPYENFSTAVRAGLKALGNNDGKTITFENLLKLVVTLMNQFYVPMKAIVLRLVETSFFKTDFAELFLGYDKIPEEFFTQRVKELVIEMGYTKFIHPSRKKWIEGLAEKLDIAEREGLVSPSKIAHMREKFDLKGTTTTVPELDIPLDTQEGLDTE